MLYGMNNINSLVIALQLLRFYTLCVGFSFFEISTNLLVPFRFKSKNIDTLNTAEAATTTKYCTLFS